LIITYLLGARSTLLAALGPPSGSLRYTAFRRLLHNPRVPPRLPQLKNNREMNL
jgi:hypothetical protein